MPLAGRHTRRTPTGRSQRDPWSRGARPSLRDREQRACRYPRHTDDRAHRSLSSLPTAKYPKKNSGSALSPECRGTLATRSSYRSWRSTAADLSFGTTPSVHLPSPGSASLTRSRENPPNRLCGRSPRRYVERTASGCVRPPARPRRCHSASRYGWAYRRVGIGSSLGAYAHNSSRDLPQRRKARSPGFPGLLVPIG